MLLRDGGEKVEPGSCFDWHGTSDNSLNRKRIRPPALDRLPRGVRWEVDHSRTCRTLAQQIQHLGVPCASAPRDRCECF